MLVELLQLFAWLLTRTRRLTFDEKHRVLDCLVRIGQNFIRDYNGVTQLGSTRMDLPARDHVRVPALPFTEDQT